MLDAVDGPDLGAYDYITKSSDPKELRARMRAALRGHWAHREDLALAEAMGRQVGLGVHTRSDA